MSKKQELKEIRDLIKNCKIFISLAVLFVVGILLSLIFNSILWVKMIKEAKVKNFTIPTTKHAAETVFAVMVVVSILYLTWMIFSLSKEIKCLKKQEKEVKEWYE